MPLVLIALLVGPVLAGLAGIVMPAFGVLPAAGLTEPSLAPLRALIAWPGVERASLLSLGTGMGATVLALGLALVIASGWDGARGLGRIKASLGGFLAVPHAATAFGLAFLIAPSGWLVRLLSPWATGWERPPDLLILNDPWGLALVAGLVVKEIPFLLLMILAALPQVPLRASGQVMATLGYDRRAGWLLTVLPPLYAQIRLPVYVVLAFSMSAVEPALILGPSTPPPLSVQILRWMSDPDLSQRSLAAAAALWQLALVLGALGLWRLLEFGAETLGRRWVASGQRPRLDRGAGWLSGGVAGALALALVGGMAVLALWSVARGWRFPAPLPSPLTSAHWARHSDTLAKLAGQTALIAAVTVGIALCIVIPALESRRKPVAEGLIYAPLLVPQTAFLPGLQTWFLWAGFDQGIGPVILAHLVFVLPYLYLALRDPWAAVDPRYAQVGASLALSPWARFWRLKLPLLTVPVLTAVALGCSVSVAQYLPSLLIGGGRVATLTTEAVALASGADRRAISVFALAQAGAALGPFLLAAVLPALVFRRRKGMLT